MATAAEAMGPETAEQSTDTRVRQKAEALRTMVASGPCRGGALALQPTYAQERRGRGVGGISKLGDWHEMPLLKKPLGEICSSSGEQGRHTACDSGLDSTQPEPSVQQQR